MLFYTIAGQKVALNGLYNTDNNVGEPMCPPILLSGLVMLSEGLAKNLERNISGIWKFSTTIHFVEHFLLESLLFLFFFLFHYSIVCISCC